MVLSAPGLVVATAVPVVTSKRLVLCVPNGPTPVGPALWVTRRALQRAIPVLVVHAWTPSSNEPGSAHTTSTGSEEAAAAQPAALMVDHLRANGVTATAQTIRGPVADAIVSLLEPDDEVVLGTEPDRPLRHALFAHVVHEVLRQAPGVVVVVSEAWDGVVDDPLRVVVSHDGTPQAEAALAWAVDAFDGTDAVLALDRALPPGHPLAGAEEDDRGLLLRARALVAGRGLAGVLVNKVTAVRSGTALELDDTSRGAAALVLGNHRVSTWAGALGYSITELATYHASCPVVLVPRA
jgi:nucleotide-binding universal stress UspA family protein